MQKPQNECELNEETWSEPEKILFVDDEPILGKMVCDYFKSRSKLAVVTSTDPNKA
ncbi:MAG: hypothetical protein M0036_18940 [Desulfobacteraceae bacterium]|nr:hypothetical protein [Desulfobacteraceae bacterium]